MFFFFLFVICLLNLPFNSLFDSFLCAFCKKHFVFIPRQHLTTCSVFPACHHAPCQNQHNKSGRKKCLACQCLFYFLLSRLQGLVLTQVQITEILKRDLFYHLPKRPSFIRTLFQINLWDLSLTLPRRVIKRIFFVTPQKGFYFPLHKNDFFLAGLQLSQKQITAINR